MIENELYNNYKIDFSDKYEQFKEAYIIPINTKRQIQLTEENNLKTMKTQQIKQNYKNINFILYIGTFKDKPCIIINHETIDEDNTYIPLIETYYLKREIYPILTRAVLVSDWYRTHQYCGGCGAKTKIDEKDMMMKCPKCGQLHYSRIAPAIIVAINNNGKLLMAKHSYHTRINYALIAGFMEAGENIEEAVHREVKEEVGINIKNLQYIKSQSWPYPNSLMIGFTADYASGEIKVDNDEILEAKWFTPDEIDMPESDISISSYLIRKFIKDHT